MPKTKTPLSARTVALIDAEGLTAVGGAIGLYLRVSGESRYFVYRYVTKGGKRSMVSLGPTPPMTLRDARTRAIELKAIVDAGGDPAENNRLIADEAKRKLEAERLERDRLNRTVRYCCMEFIRQRADNGYWKNNIRGESVAVSYVENHITPRIGNIPIDQLTPDDVFKMLKPIWQSTTDTGRNCKSIIYHVCRYAAAMGWRSGENPASIDGKLGVLLEPLARDRKRRQNYPALDFREVPALIATLRSKGHLSYLMLAFAILTCLRAKMVRMARWEDVDWENRTLRIREESIKTKGRGDHMVYLSSAAIEFLKELPRPVNSIWIFPSARSNGIHPLSTGAMDRVIDVLHQRSLATGGPGLIDKVQSEKAGRPVIVTQHGTSRTTFKTWSRTGENRKLLDEEAVELCMAHKLEDNYDGAYNRATLEPERRFVMEEWGKFCTKQLC